MDKEYILSFSSFYKAAYARDILETERINSTLRKLPPELVRSCSTGLYLKTNSIGTVKNVLDRRQIFARGFYEIEKEKGSNQKHYIRV